MKFRTFDSDFSSNKRILFLLCTLVVLIDSWIWFGFPNYYSEYEAIVSKLFDFNFGSENHPSRFNLYSPVGYFMYEGLWGVLNQFSDEIPWYDVTMWLLFLTSKIAILLGLWMGTSEIYDRKTRNFSVSILSIALFSYVLFNWAIRVQIHTHIAYMVCFSFSFLLIQLAKKRLASSGFLTITYLGFMLGAFLRWEVGLIVIAILSIYLFLFGGVAQIIRHKLLYIMFSLFVGHIVYTYATDESFYRQVEPNGEYAVLYAKSVHAPARASEREKLSYDLLNNWMLDDTAFVNLEFFRTAVVGETVNIQANRLKFKDVVTSIGRKFFLNHDYIWVMILLGFFLLFKPNWRLILFIGSLYVLLSVLDLANLITQRHLNSVMSGSLLLISCTQFPPLLQKNKRLLIAVLSLSVLCQQYSVHVFVNSQKQKESAKTEFANRVMKKLDGSVLYTDAQYATLASNETFNDLHVLDKTVFLSLQQYSYSQFFDQYLKFKVGVGFGNYRSIYEAICAESGHAYLLISERRLNLLKKVLLVEKSAIKFETIIPCEVDCNDGGAFNQVTLQKLSNTLRTEE
jgi:hypothetical protein